MSMKLKLYKVTQDSNNEWDSYQGIIVAAYNEQDARSIHPSGEWPRNDAYSYDWVAEKEVDNLLTVQYLGVADKSVKRGVLLTDFLNG
jgi:hypothetical protein